MPKKSEFDVDKLLKDLTKEEEPKNLSLRELFERRIEQLDITVTNARDIMNIQLSTLNGILDGSQRRVDYTNLFKIADFLQITKEDVVRLYVDQLQKNFSAPISISSRDVEFIKDNFDLSALKKAKFISSISDFDEVKTKIENLFELKRITDYQKPPLDVAFSAGKVKPKNDLSRAFWIYNSETIFKEMDNPNVYDRQGLIDYFPEIRWHSTSVELGFFNVIKTLYKLGVTVIFQNALSTLHLRGATFSVNDSPCIVITNYKNFYPTIWFALIHELFHVLFDWDEIRTHKYHLSVENTDQLSIKEKENEADNFAREYLFSVEKTNYVRSKMYDHKFLEKYARDNHVDTSFIYVFHAYDMGNDRSWWGKARKKSPSISHIEERLGNPWDSPKPISKYVKTIKHKYYL